jgi:hypothetical protein
MFLGKAVLPSSSRCQTNDGSAMVATRIAPRPPMLPSLQRNEIGTSEVDPFRSSILGPKLQDLPFLIHASASGLVVLMRVNYSSRDGN